MRNAVREVKLPFRAGGDGVLVEEGLQFAPGTESLVPGEKFLDDAGGPAGGVVLAGVGDEEVVGLNLSNHGVECERASSRRPLRDSWSACQSLYAPSMPQLSCAASTTFAMRSKSRSAHGLVNLAASSTNAGG